jgi:hypothetical protein
MASLALAGGAFVFKPERKIMSKAHTHGGRTHLVCENRETGEVLWEAFLTIEEYLRYIRKWCETGGDPHEALEAITKHE